MPRRPTPRAVALLILVLLAPTAVDAGVLPVVVDATRGEAFWWAADPPVPAGAFDEVLFHAAEAGDAAWVSPRATSTDGPISRILRRADITPSNARSLATLFGASHVLVGRVVLRDFGQVPWLGIGRATVAFEGAIIDASAGTTVATLVMTRTAHDATDAVGVATRRLAEAVVAVGRVSSRHGTDAGGDVDGVVIVRSPDGAVPFVGLRGALREAHPGVVDVSEVWATEGRVALRLELDEGVRFADVVPGIVGLEGVVLDGALVVRSDLSGQAITIEVRAVPRDDAAAP